MRYGHVPGGCHCGCLCHVPWWHDIREASIEARKHGRFNGRGRLQACNGKQVQDMLMLMIGSVEQCIEQSTSLRFVSVTSGEDDNLSPVIEMCVSNEFAEVII